MITRRHTSAFLAALVAATVLSGCGIDVGSSGDQGFVDGSGAPTVLPVSKREKPGEVAGETLEGARVSLSDYLGKVVVINVWGSWCSTCRAEAGDLAVAAAALSKRGVVFLGINTRDTSRANALAFQRNRKVSYPSIFDPGGTSLLAFTGTLPPAAIPSTVVIDAKGRVAARILGALPSARTLIDLVSDIAQPTSP